MTYLPMLFLGPITPYRDAASALQSRKITWEGIGDGLMRLLWGAFKKLVIAARLGVVISTISGKPEYNGAYALLAMLLFSVQLYADFSGGMDMVLGVSRMLGVTLIENFRQPYLSQSVKEFWKRWHISLGGWLTKYIYIPLGGNRKHKSLLPQY
jgi:D-alanyl-lipoteichoic acid acyltransferase DltB (MBOAT superfamily)